MRVSGDWLTHPGSLAVLAMLNDAGHQAFFVGGCVRNAALGVPVADIDIATDARPEEVMALAERIGLRAIGTGIEHGTVTVISNGLPHEVTTFRRDVETDGRRAVVAFSDDICDDAARRDFTMNALYARSDGRVLDPTGEGITDLKARQVRFIGRAEDRIAEDYLRILRFFRFHAWYAAPGFDPETLAAVSSLSAGLETISKERIGHEIRRLLAAPEAAPALATMEQIGVIRCVLPGADVAAEAVLETLEAQLHLAPGWLRRLAALGGEEPADNLRLSRTEARGLDVRRDAAETTDGPGALGYRLGADAGIDVLLLRGAIFQAAPDPDDLAAVRAGAAAVFPLRAADLQPALSGPELGRTLAALETRWINSGFSLSRDELLS